jgi:hypothetical protein
MFSFACAFLTSASGESDASTFELPRPEQNDLQTTRVLPVKELNLPLRLILRLLKELRNFLFRLPGQTVVMQRS